MARDFGTNGSITFGAGGAAGTDRNITQVVLAQLTADSAGLMQGRNGTTRRWSFLSSGGSLFAMDDFGTGGNTVLDEDTWYVLAVSKTSGAVAYRYHWKELGAGSWTHTNTSDSITDGTATITNIQLGQAEEVGDCIIAAAAVFDGALSDGAIEALGETSMADWLAAGPLWAVQLNQASTGTAVEDLTGGGGDQTAISGTSVVSDPPGWSYYTGGASAELAATLPAITGAFTGEAAADAALAGTLPAITGAFVGEAVVDATLNATLPALIGSLAAEVAGTGALAGTLPTITATMAAEVSADAVLAGTLPAIEGAFTAEADAVVGALAATLPAITGALVGEAMVDAVLAGSLPAIVGAFVGDVDTGATFYVRFGGELIDTGLVGAVRVNGASVAFG